MTTNERPKKRRRSAKSCEQCRARKVRCDRKAPCGPCSRTRASLQCSFSARSPSPLSRGRETEPLNSEPDSGQAALGHPTPSSVLSGATREPPRQRHTSDVQPSPITPRPSSRADGGSPMLQVQRQLQALESRIRSQEGRAEPPETQAGFRDTKTAVEELTRRIQQLEQRPPSSERHASSSGKVDGLSIEQPPPRLHTSSNKTKLFGPTHWAHRVDKLEITQPFSNQRPEPSLQGLKDELANLIKECKGLRQTIKSQSAANLREPVPDLHSTIPSRQVCDNLVQCYLQTFEVVYRVVHIPSFWEDYEQYWLQPHTASSAFLMKFVLILSIGSTFYADRENLISDAYAQLAQKWAYSAQWWLVGPSEKSTMNLDGVEVFCLLILSRRMNALGPSPWLSASSLMQMAVAMGLHRDPSVFPTLTAFQSERRVRLWMTVMEISLHSSLSTGVPLLIPGESDVRPPQNIRDANLSTARENCLLPSISEVFTETSLSLLLDESLSLRIQIISYTNGKSTKSYPEALRLGGEMRNVCRRVASFCQSWLAARSSTELALSDFHRKFLDMEMRRYILALHTPFVAQARKDPQFYYSRKACFESAMVIASYSEALCLPMIPQDFFSRLIIMGRGSFKGPLGLDIISALGLEVVTQLEEEKSSQIATSYPTDPLDELAKLNRSPVVRKLEHILDQLLQIIALGSPSMKRYNFLASMLGQIRALESGDCVKRVVYETVKRSLQDCQAVLKPWISNVLEQPRHDGLGASNLVATPCPPSTLSSGLGLELIDFMFDSDLQGHLGLPLEPIANTVSF